MSFFVFQNDSPTGAGIDNLGIYLLVSLFFVMATMIECTVALVVKGVYEKQFEHDPTKTSNQPEPRSKEWYSLSQRKNEHSDEVADKTSNTGANIQIKKNSFLSSTSRMPECSNQRKKHLDSLEFETISNVTDLIPSPKSIDITALIMFPTSYVLFNFFYWLLII